MAEDPASSELVSTLDLSTSSHSKLASADLNWAKMAKVLKPELKRFLIERVAVNIPGGRKVPKLKCPFGGARVGFRPC